MELKLKIGDVEQNKFNSDKEVNELASELRSLKAEAEARLQDIERLRGENGRQTEELRRKTEQADQGKDQIDRILRSTIKSAIAGLDQVPYRMSCFKSLYFPER